MGCNKSNGVQCTANCVGAGKLLAGSAGEIQ